MLQTSTHSRDLNDVMHDVYINQKSYDDVQEHLVEAFSQLNCESFQDHISAFIDQYIKVFIYNFISSVQRVKKVLNDLIRRINAPQRQIHCNDLILHFVEKLAQSYDAFEKIGLEVSKLISYYNQCSKENHFPVNFKTKEVHRSQFIKRVFFDMQYFVPQLCMIYKQLIERAKKLFQEHSVMEKYQNTYGQLEKIKDIVDSNSREMSVISYNGTYGNFFDDSFDEEISYNVTELGDFETILDVDTKKKKRKRKNKHPTLEQPKHEILSNNEAVVRLRISDDEFEQYLLNDTDQIQKGSSNNEVKEFEKRLEQASLSLADDQKFKPNVSIDWIKKLKERVQKAKKQTA